METALRNLSCSVELLAVAALSGEVEQWDGTTVSRAFRWARYCEQLYSTFHGNPAVRGEMEVQLKATNQSLKSALPGYSEVTFSDLARCQHHLLVGLLKNPKVPISIMKLLFGSYSPPADSMGHVTGLCSHIIQSRSACKVLRPLCARSPLGADAEVQAVLMMERLAALTGQGGEGWSAAGHFLDSVLQGCEGDAAAAAAAEHFCLVIAAALLTTTNSESAAQDFLLQWLVEKHGTLQRMCSVLPSPLLMELVQRHLMFRDAYCEVLKRWASDMEYSISDGEWVHGSPTLTFQKLTEHFQALFETCPTQRDIIVKELNTSKASDGDFDVRGLSVWGDLLSALLK